MNKSIHKLILKNKMKKLLIVLNGFLFFPVFAIGLVPFKQGAQWGYSDFSGNLVYDAIYEEAHPFSEGIARVKKDGRYGYISAAGQQFFSQAIEDCKDFSESFAAVKIKIGQKWGFIGRNLMMKISPEYDSVSSFYEGVATVKIGQKWGIIDKTGKRIVACQYDNLKDCRENLMAACLNGKWGFISQKGETVIDFRYKDAAPFSEGLACVSEDGKKYIYINKTGTQAVKGEFERGGAFQNGKAVVKKDRGYGIISKEVAMVKGSRCKL